MISIFDILVKTTIEENDEDDNRNKIFVLFHSVLHCKDTKLCNCCMKKENSKLIVFYCLWESPGF